MGTNTLYYTTSNNIGLTFGTATLSGAPTFNVGTGGQLTLGALAGASATSLTKSGPGLMILSTAATSYAGTSTTVNGGTLRLGIATALNSGTTGTVTINNTGTLELTGATAAATYNFPITLNNGGTLRGFGGTPSAGSPR